MLQDEQGRSAEAIEWVIRLRDPASADWVGFTSWLEADAANNEAYEAVALADRAIGAALSDSTVPLASMSPAFVASNDNQARARARHRRGIVGWATAAAAVIAGLIAYPMLSPAVSTYTVSTRPGERRTVALDDGTKIEMNGGTQITLHKGNARFASLDRGEAAFTVVHDAEDPFVVEVGRAHLQDVGTIFNVVRTGDIVETSVAQGAVLYNPGAEALRLDAGQILRVSTTRSDARVGTVDPAVVGAWRQDRLVYRNASLAQVASDLSRNLGVGVSVSPNIAARPFSGVIFLGDDRAALFPRIGALLDVDVASRDGGWKFSSRTHVGR